MAPVLPVKNTYDRNGAQVYDDELLKRVRSTPSRRSQRPPRLPPRSRSRTQGTKVTSGLTVAITGAGAAAYSIAAGDGGCTGRSLGLTTKNKTCTVKVTFAPSAAGTFAAALTVTVAQPKAQVSVNLTGTGAAAPLGPTVTVTVNDPFEIGNCHAQFTVQFSEDVTSFETDDVSFAGGNAVGESVSDITGSGGRTR